MKVPIYAAEPKIFPANSAQDKSLAVEVARLKVQEASETIVNIFETRILLHWNSDTFSNNASAR